MSSTLQLFRKELGCSRDEQLIRAAQDPFYTGYDLYQGELRLPYVESHINLDQFKNLQARLEPLCESYLDRINSLKKQYIINPLCGYCRKPLRYYIDKMNHTAHYSCSRKHKKVCISLENIQEIVKMVVDEIIHKLNGKKMNR